MSKVYAISCVRYRVRNGKMLGLTRKTIVFNRVYADSISALKFVNELICSTNDKMIAEITTDSDGEQIIRCYNVFNFKRRYDTNYTGARDVRCTLIEPVKIEC